MDRSMDETDRKHCLLDLHGIRETTDHVAASVAFVEKWGDGLGWLLGDTAESERAEELERDLTEAEAEAKKSDETIIAMTNALEKSRDKLNDAIALIEEAL
jgi:hypothetical protein